MHAIEVQDFANYELIIDVRSRADFEADHIPGAVQMTPVLGDVGANLAAVRGEHSIEHAIAAGQQATRRYAKRQYTWFAHQPPAEWPRFTEPLDQGADGALELLMASE